LPQEVELFPGPIKQNICRMRDDLPDEAVYKAASLAGVHELVCRLPQGYETELTADGGLLSGGEKQRIALARAFFGDPAMVVLDEPNSNLDAAGEQALIDSLQRAKKRGMTVAVVTQRPTLLGIVDKVMILKDGRPVAFGPPEQVLKPSVPPPAKLQSRSTARPSADGNKRSRKKARNANGSTAIKGAADVR
jgi:ATP-binding cassette subfamily C protein